MIRSAKYGHIGGCFSSIAGIETSLYIPNSMNDVKFSSPRLFNESSSHAALQRRRFLGCGDGEEGGVLSKVYEERRVLGYNFLFFANNYFFFGFLVAVDNVVNFK